MTTKTEEHEHEEEAPMQVRDDWKSMKNQIKGMIELVKLGREQQRDYAKQSDKRLADLEDQLIELKAELKKLKNEKK